MTLTLEDSFMNIVDPSIIFPDQVESPTLDVFRQSYDQNTITAQS